MFYHGHLAHPDIWMLWFSFFVAACSFTRFVVRAAIILYYRYWRYE